MIAISLISISVAINRIKWSDDKKSYLINEVCRRVHVVNLVDPITMATNILLISRCMSTTVSINLVDIVLKIHDCKVQPTQFIKFKSLRGVVYDSEKNLVSTTSTYRVMMHTVFFNNTMQFVLLNYISCYVWLKQFITLHYSSRNHIRISDCLDYQDSKIYVRFSSSVGLIGWITSPY